MTIRSDRAKDQHRRADELAARQAERKASERAPRRDFELENLLRAYDALWSLAREAALTHEVDSRSPDELGYGGTQLPPGVTQDLAQAKEAAKSLRLILDDETRHLAQTTQQLMS